MTESQHKFGDFFYKIAKAAEKSYNTDAQIFMEEWVDMVSTEEWQKVKKMPLTEELAVAFVEDMAGMFWRRLSAISSERLYDETMESGHNFLRQIKEIAKRFSIEIDYADRPLTPSEALLSGDFAEEAEEIE